ncbi:hypothetical protein FGM00_13110 [Aggregatimonas sangjinii]|uniref:DUF7079 domain-containing protein n=1 Tax=Aggregatimonas sangjinii TaxID=2583587 RepID=A0A5B7SQN4_9FLAO|nr:hypothetical protein [Aggregatimonas sangjinii]QCX01005.1 hypothetical protein FGM00_13110 [Aggregatimonas sangjinii]
MTEGRSIKNKQQLWIALSELYLDTELQPDFFAELAKRIYESPFSYKEVREIDKKEVFPVLYQNVLSVAGVWDGFDEEWLITSIVKKNAKRNFLSQGYHGFLYSRMQHIFKEEWKQIEIYLHKLRCEE